MIVSHRYKLWFDRRIHDQRIDKKRQHNEWIVFQWENLLLKKRFDWKAQIFKTRSLDVQLLSFEGLKYGNFVHSNRLLKQIQTFNSNRNFQFKLSNKTFALKNLNNFFKFKYKLWIWIPFVNESYTKKSNNLNKEEDSKFTLWNLK